MATFPCPHCGAAKITLNGLCPKCLRFSNIQAGPLMTRHVIDGHDVLLPADVKMHKPLKPGDEIDDCPLGGTY